MIKNTPDLDTLEGFHNRHRKVLKEAHMKQGGLCFWCNEPTPLWWEITTEEFALLGKKRMATREHLIPQSAGGKHDIDNIVCACHDCNNLRGTIPINQFKWVAANPERFGRWKSLRARRVQGAKEAKQQRRREHEQRVADAKARKAEKAKKKQARIEEAEYNYMVKVAKKMLEAIKEGDARMEKYRCQERHNSCQKTAKILNFA